MPLGELSIFLKFYLLRNTNEVAKSGFPRLNARIMEENQIIYENNYPLRLIQPINLKRLEIFDNTFDYLDEDEFFPSELKLYQFNLQILPDVTLLFGNVSRDEGDECILQNVSIQIVNHNPNRDNCNVLYKTRYPILYHFKKGIEKYNSELESQLRTISNLSPK
ncbi:MAG: hypothetical protein KDE33_08455 [Bacteroidetes bacterium]|nr:hypothetical protein [Bacteroidota bacterium]